MRYCNVRLAWMQYYFCWLYGDRKKPRRQALAKRLGRRFVDTDAWIEHEANMPIAQLFATEGEAAFRQRERQAIARACQEKEMVVATGGGAIVDRENARTMKASGPVICLTARPEVILQRGSRVRPLGRYCRGRIRSKRSNDCWQTEQKPTPRADITIDTSSLGPDAVIEATLTALAQSDSTV